MRITVEPEHRTRRVDVLDPRIFDARYDEERLDELKLREYRINGVIMPMLAVGDLATMMGRRSVTMRKWERLGILPRTPFVQSFTDGLGARRLYTKGMALGTVKIAREENVLVMYSSFVRKTQFTPRVKALFEAELASMTEMTA